MRINSNSFYNAGSNYSVKVNVKDASLEQDDPSKKVDDTQEESKTGKGVLDLNEEEKKVVKELSSRDTEVKVHEAAHQAAGGGLTGGASFSYQRGPDGKMYAIGGEVSISSSGGSSAQEEIRIARRIITAALAPTSPSGQDFAVASSAKVIEIKAQQQISKEAREKVVGQETYANVAGELPNSKDKEDEKLLDIPA